MRNIYKKLNILVAVVIAAVFGVSVDEASAFSTDVYAPSSRLSSGHWVKIKTSKSGMHIIPASTLKGWGFSDPQRVRVYGYGGRMMSDNLSIDEYIDDLPQAMSEWTPQGLVFYAHGPLTWTESNGRWTYKPNYYSSEAYYFLGEIPADGDERPGIRTGRAGTDGDYATTFTDVAYHEVDMVSPGSTGHTMLGEDFSQNRTQTFNFSLPGRADDDLWIQTVFALKATN